ncbi:MAG: hypothetical protein IKT71_01935 [Paludibacteraceae bacterium]|nr:hypothetical protein [Paludibacteraceae bacterium]
MFEIDGNYYIEYNDLWLREDKDGRIFVYSEPAKKDLVLYDFTLEVGDTLTTLNIDIVPMTEGDPILPGVKPVVVDYPIHLDEYVSFPIDTLIVTDVSMVMMCDSNQYKKWTFSNGMEYMEYIGNLGADFFAIIRNPWEELPTCCVEEDLVCASIYDRLVYLMDDEKRDLLNIDCPCTSWSNKWQWRTNTWNVLQFDGMAFEQTAQTWQYKLAHDTIIGGKEYTAVTRHWAAYDESAAEYVAAVRFAENQKAYIYYDNAEYLLYDFGYHEFGDTLEVFSGINNYEHFKTYKCVITDNYSTAGGIAEDTYVMDIIHPITGDTIPSALIWQEFVGSYSGFLHGGLLVPGSSNYQLLCAYKDNVLAYSVDNDAFTDNDTFIEYGCEYNAEQKPKDLFPTLWGLQRTEVEFHTDGAGAPSLVSFNEYTPTLVNGKWYLYDGRNYLREENNQVLLYSPEFEIYEDVVLYDWALEIGDTLPFTIRPFDDDKSRGAVFRVTDVSTITLLDGKKYKKWTLACGIEYIEGIGAINGEGFGNYFCIQHTAHPATYIDTRLVCASRNGQLLYQMDEAEMERLGAECLCEVETSYKSQWCNTWNVFKHSGGARLDSEETWQYKLDRDTIINGKLYSTVIYYLTSDPSQEYYMGAVRFGDDRKVYRAIGNSESVVYDFTAQVGDTLGPGVVYDVEVDSLTNLKTIYFHPYDRYEDKYIEYATVKWIEGVGSTDGFLLAKDYGTVGGASFYLLCAYRDDELKYADNKDLGCRYNAGEVTYEHFPTLAGLSRTIHEERSTNDTTRKEDFTKVVLDLSFPTLYHSQMYLRERDNKIFVESRTYKNLTELYEYVLYDFTLEVGDSLPMLYIDYSSRGDWGPIYPLSILNVVNYRKEADGTIYPGDTLVVTEVSTITLLDGKEYKKWTFNNGMEYAEGIGSLSGDFYELIANKRTTEDLTASHLVCASKNGQLLYKMDDAEMEQLETECLCEYNAEQKPEDLFPTLWGLQQTICSGYYGEEGDEWASGLTGPSQEITMMDGKPYLQWGSWYLREENDKILVYSEIQKKDLVLYDFTLELGDTLTTLNLVTPEFLEYEGIVGIVDYPLSDYDYTYPIDTLVVTELSKETLLDGKEYTRWKFSDGTVYVEGIGSMSETFFHHIADHLPVPVSYLGSYLVCVSKNNKLLYQMDDTEMERLGAECLCDYDRGPRKDNAKNGKIGGRPTPTQWNMLEVETKEMDGTPTILRAETFSYTLENDSIVANNKTYYQLARQSTKDTAITKSFVGALHFGEDEDNRVYFLRDGVEYVLYDFTAEPGDTIEIFAGINNYPQETTYTHVVVDKDTTEDGACRMFLEVVFPDETTTATNAEKVWLAGLGSIDGIVHNTAKRTSDVHAAPSRSAGSETQTSVMLCAWREDSCLYTTSHPEYDTFGCIYNQDPTAVENPTSPSSYQKFLREGQLLILHNGKTYTVMGIEMK